jgi:hypothetical protein
MADFRADVAALCGPAVSALATLPDNDGTLETALEQIAILRAARDAGQPVIEAPAALAAQVAEIEEINSAANTALSDAEAAAAAGDIAAAEASINLHLDELGSGAGRYALIGASCGPADASRATNADLTVPLRGDASQIAIGFGSVWVSEFQNDTVVRIDPDGGDIVARVDVGAGPIKAQPADDKLWVRTRDSYDRIDPQTNTVDATLPKADVGPSANRNWAVDGAMWICDGRTLHRYNPTTIEPVARIDLGFDCEQVFATPDLVVAWSSDDPGLTTAAAASVIDPTTNQVLATIDLPVDVLSAVVLKSAVFFAGRDVATAAVVDRATWTVTSTPDLGRVTGGGGGIATDGESIFVPTKEGAPEDVLVVDATTFSVVDVIEPLGANHVAVLDGSLWIADGILNVTQRVDLDR